MAKFDNAKVGDKVWSIENGWGEVERIVEVGIRVRFVLSDTVECSEVFTFDGKRYKLGDKFPMLFWNEFHIPTEEEDKNPFDLVKFLREKLEPKEFVKGAENVTLFYNWSNNTWEIGIYNFSYVETTYISKISEGDCWLKDILNILTQERITPQQLKEAYKELGWL